MEHLSFLVNAPHGLGLVVLSLIGLCLAVTVASLLIVGRR